MVLEIEELEEQWEREKKEMCARMMRLREGLEAVIDYFAESDSENQCASDMAEIAERALRVS
jgi:aspartate/tyrosine/aromatic aminotransferase